MREPLILGHESAGIVSAIGSNVTTLAPGDKVALEVGQPCGTCSHCKEGRYNICGSMNFRASARRFPHCQGTLQERINAPAAWCHKLPANVSLEVGALLEPMSVALHACRRAQLPPNATVVVFGAGAVGLLTAAMAKANGATEVLIADIDRGRLVFALEKEFADTAFTVPLRLGADLGDKLHEAEATAQSLCAVKRRRNGEPMGQVDAVFECTGVPACAQTAVYVARAGGRVVLVGMGHPVYKLPVSTAALREVDLVGSFRYAGTYPACIRLVAQPGEKGMPDFETLVTHRYRGLEKSEDAFKLAGKTVDDEGKLVLKVMVDLGRGDGSRL